MSRQILDQGLKDQAIDLDLNYQDFEKFYKLLKAGNEKTDLTNIIEEEEAYIKHFLDSLCLFKVAEFYEEKKLVDIGTGAGFPGLPLKLANPNLDITLLDSLKKRLNFLDSVIDQMDLKNIHTIHMRGEDAGKDPKMRESFDLATSRAVSRLNILVELALPLVKPGGLFVAMKGKNVDQEVQEAEKAIKTLGGSLKEVIKFNLTKDDNQRALVVIEKVKASPKKYPRAYGQIKKRPL
ncbi:MAG: 16S rRNA (guanine(527)-N(7))-methyltransferase RsmG [Bacillota bacterium]|nr:16S rRNA (guanine(527)-N(7))-methyltransferase RsmG [Bacillota bacterium]